MTRVGRWTCSISQAVVADLPVPVAPSSTASFSPARTRRARSAMAVGWSPAGWKSDDDLEGRQAALEVGGRTHAPTVCRATDRRHRRRHAGWVVTVVPMVAKSKTHLATGTGRLMQPWEPREPA